MPDHRCPFCLRLLKMPEGYAGRWGRCKYCKNRFIPSRTIEEFMVNHRTELFHESCETAFGPDLPKNIRKRVLKKFKRVVTPSNVIAYCKTASLGMGYEEVFTNNRIVTRRLPLGRPKVIDVNEISDISLLIHLNPTQAGMDLWWSMAHSVGLMVDRERVVSFLPGREGNLLKDFAEILARQAGIETNLYKLAKRRASLPLTKEEIHRRFQPWQKELSNADSSIGTNISEEVLAEMPEVAARDGMAQLTGGTIRITTADLSLLAPRDEDEATADTPRITTLTLKWEDMVDVRVVQLKEPNPLIEQPRAAVLYVLTKDMAIHLIGVLPNAAGRTIAECVGALAA